MFGGTLQARKTPNGFNYVAWFTKMAPHYCLAVSIRMRELKPKSIYLRQRLVPKANYSKGKIHARYDEWYANVYGIFWSIYVVDNGGFNHPSVLVHLFKGRIFRVVKSAYGGANHQHSNVVFLGFFYLAEPTWILVENTPHGSLRFFFDQSWANESTLWS